jgi:nucleotide-binding universal stress UspA family protein
MYRRMLVPLDGSEVAEVVFPYAKELAGRLGTEVMLLHIANPNLKDFQPMVQAYVDHAADIIRAGAVAEGKPVTVKGELVTGYPPDEILRYAEEKKADLILMASHGRSGRSKRWEMGSVAEKVLRAATIPVLLARAEAPDQLPFDRWPGVELMVPLDGSELAESVLPYAEALAAKGALNSARVVLLRACEPPTMPTYYSPELSEIPLHWGQYAQQETARCKQVSVEYLSRIETRLRSSNIEVRSEVLVGKASDEMVNYANKHPYSLIVMASHGRSGLSRLVYGSTALNILVGVSNPTLVVKPTAKAAAKPSAKQ